MEKRSPPRIEALNSSDGPLVQVTVLSLAGISCRSNELPSTPQEGQFYQLCQGNVHASPSGPRVPNLSAAVAFSGSADDMRVGSSFLCGQTGKVMVESQRARLSPSFESGNPEMKKGVYPLVAEWEQEPSLPPHCSPLSPSIATKPHLKIRLPSTDPRLPAVPLSSLNRDCNVIQDFTTPRSHPPSLDESDASTATHERDGQLDEESAARGGSIVWSASGAGMPEIIELNIFFIMDVEDVVSSVSETDVKSDCSKWKNQDTTLEVGIAYLVFFGNDLGTTIMDLPVKKHVSKQSIEQLREPLISLSDDATLRIRVDVLPSGVEQPPPPVTTDRMHSKSLLANMQDLDPILKQLRLAHENHLKLRRQRAEQRAAAQYQKRKFSGGRAMCMSFLELVGTLSDVVKCSSDGDNGLLHSDSIASTIATAPSLDI